MIPLREIKLLHIDRINIETTFTIGEPYRIRAQSIHYESVIEARSIRLSPIIQIGKFKLLHIDDIGS